MNRIEINKLTDEQLFLEFQQRNNHQAFEILVKRYKNALMNFVYRFSGDYDNTIDIVQDTFVKVFRFKDSYNNISRFSTWLYTIATNLAKTEYKKRKRFNIFSFNNTENKDDYFEIEDNSNRPDNYIENLAKEIEIQKALLKLNIKYREPVILRDIQGLSYEEISDILKVDIGTVKSRINRGRKKLQSLLTKIYKD